MINTMFAEEKKGEKEEKILCAENQKSCTQNSTPLENLFLGQIHSVMSHHKNDCHLHAETETHTNLISLMPNFHQIGLHGETILRLSDFPSKLEIDIGWIHNKRFFFWVPWDIFCALTPVV
jgi:hypothetical protein